MELNMLVGLAGLLRVKRRDDLLSTLLHWILDDELLIAAPNRLRLRYYLNMLLLLRPRISVHNKLLGGLLRVLRRRACENWRRTCENGLLLIIFALSVQALRRVLLNHIRRWHHVRGVTLHSYELLTVGTWLQYCLDLVLRVNHMLDRLHLWGVCDLIRGRYVLQLVLLCRLIEKDLLTTVRSLQLNTRSLLDLSLQHLSLELQNRCCCSDSRVRWRVLMHDLHCYIRRDVVLLLNDVSWLLDDGWWRTRENRLGSSYLLIALEKF